jgi:thiamine biosynthesis lipoprotein
MRKLCFGFAICLLLAGTTRGAALKRFSRVEAHMGTRFQIIVYASDETTANQATRAAFDRVSALNRIMSDYDRSSELMKLCAKAGGPPVRVSPELFFVLEKAQALARHSEGAFDVTLGPVTHEWRLARKSQRLPVPDELKQALSLTGHTNLVLDGKTRTAKLLKKGMKLDLGGIAKGYAADEAVKVLRRHGLTHVLVAAAGDIVAGDAPPGAKGWNVAIAALPGSTRKDAPSLLLANSAVSTSGDAEQYVEIGDKRYSHIVDPRTGTGVLGQFSVTVTARRGVDADSLATAVAVLGVEKGIKLIEATDGAACLFVSKSKKGELVTRSKHFKEKEKHP